MRMAAEPGLSDAECEASCRWVEETGAPEAAVAEAVSGLRRRARVREVARRTFPPPGTRPHWPTGLRFKPYDAEVVLDGDREFGAGLRALKTPGHTPGNFVVVAEREGLLFSGDQLLPDLTPTPATSA